VHEINKDTEIFISLSSNPSNFGTSIYNKLFKEFKINAIYKSFNANKINDLKKNINFFNIKGVSISMPFKEKVIGQLDSLDKISKKLQIINTIKNINGKLYGYNSDYLAIRKVLLDIKNIKDYTFIISGMGAIAKTIVFALNNMGVKKILIKCRNKKKIKDFIKKFKCDEYNHGLNLKNSQIFLINCTPIGMTGKNLEKIPFTNKLIKEASIAMDLVNHPINTKFIKLANIYKKKTIGGNLVSLYQIKYQFEIYTNKKIKLSKLKNIFKKLGKI
jgi:shikimate dehydrogenase